MQYEAGTILTIFFLKNAEKIADCGLFSGAFFLGGSHKSKQV